MKLKEELEKELSKIVTSLADEEVQAQVSVPNVLSKGDFSTNIAMKLAGKIGAPMEAGEKIVEKLRENKEFYSKFAKIELVNPGFINFFLSQEMVTEGLSSALKGFEESEANSSMILEFGDLNPFKEPHIGHIRNFALGEALSRLFEFRGQTVYRANYEGDVGMHVAKAIWGILNSEEKFEDIEAKSIEEKIRFLAKAYAAGAKAFEEDEAKKSEIVAINKKVYEIDPQIYEIWEKGRAWSLEYFEGIYKRLGVKYEKYYFESETTPIGKKVVLENPEVFPKDNGAYVFKGEDYGLHTRVFINSEGNPTYEAKDLGLAITKNKDFPNAEKSIIMTANEQADYFKVLIKALSKIDEKVAEKTAHLSYGFVDLKEGKMSSRSGNIVSGVWLLDETLKKIKEGFKEVEEDVAQQIAVGAVKWSMLKFSRESNISFSIDESIDLTGNSGPYMQYTYARISSILDKSGKGDLASSSVKNYPPELLALGRLICQFESAVKIASDHFSPNYLTEYLFILAQKYNAFYENERIIGADTEDEKLAVSLAVKNVIGQGLKLLGIETPEKI